MILWWGFVHFIAAMGLVCSAALPPWLSAAGLVLLALHACSARPRSVQKLELGMDGFWRLPMDDDASNFVLAPGSSVGLYWVDLRLKPLESRPGVPLRRVLLLRDQFEADAWRALQAALRRGDGH